MPLLFHRQPGGKCMQQACRQLFEQQTQQDNHSRPTKQIRHLQINFGIVKGFPDGILRQAQHFGSNSRFPANADAANASGKFSPDETMMVPLVRDIFFEAS